MFIKSLENDETCQDDLYYDFYEINSMSTYVYTIIEKNMEDNLYLGTNLSRNYLNKLLSFIDELLDDFNQILDKKILLVNNIILKNEYDIEYQNYSLKLSKHKTYFYKHLMKRKDKMLSECIKEMWCLEL